MEATSLMSPALARGFFTTSATWEAFKLSLRILFTLFFVYLFLPALGLCCCLGLSLAAMSRGYSPVVVCGLLTAEAFLVQNIGSRAWVQ